jgi:hypothetical protein
MSSSPPLQVKDLLVGLPYCLVALVASCQSCPTSPGFLESNVVDNATSILFVSRRADRLMMKGQCGDHMCRATRTSLFLAKVISKGFALLLTLYLW